jgi:glycosyl-4,4'-diaponeurosporenoate acyltransferase
MPLVKFTTFWILTLNILGWPVIHLCLAWIFLRFPASAFQSNLILPTFQFEIRFCERFLAIRRWKDLLPDGAVWFRGAFPKRNLRGRDSEYFMRFIQESRRGEAAHWAMLFAAPIFIIWNPPWAVAVMFAYAILANLPCIVTQRYNRLRLLHIQQLRARSPHNASI